MVECFPTKVGHSLRECSAVQKPRPLGRGTLLLCLLFVSTSLMLSADEQPVEFPVLLPWATDVLDPFLFDERYQIGEEWGKYPVTQDSLKDKSLAFRRASKATARVGGGTGFYLGKFANYHVMATNHHVMPRGYDCSRVSFPLLNKRFSCKKYLGSWKQIDLALFVIDVTSIEDENILASVAENFAFSRPIEKGQELLTIGFGSANNPRRQLMANQDNDCMAFSRTDEYRLMNDPDKLNPGTYAAWSFSNGCDVSHGDSGSAMVDRSTGEVLGIIWTGQIPKDDRVRETAFLNDIFEKDREEVWTELSYAVPAEKIYDVLDNLLKSGNFSGVEKMIIESLLK